MLGRKRTTKTIRSVEQAQEKYLREKIDLLKGDSLAAGSGAKEEIKESDFLKQFSEKASGEPSKKREQKKEGKSKHDAKTTNLYEIC